MFFRNRLVHSSQAILSATDASFTINLSLGERPVYFPVEAETAPVEVNFLHFALILFH